MTSKKSKNQVASAVAQGLGALAWWTLTGAQITPRSLRKVLADAGETTINVPDIDKAAAVRDAARLWRQGRGNADRFRTEVVAEQVGTAITVGLLQREQVKADEVRWKQIDQVDYDVVQDSFGTHGGRPELDSFIALAQQHQKYLDHNYIRPEIIQASLKRMRATCIRPQGGLYYVPVQNLADLERLAGIVGAVGGSSLDYTHVPDDEVSRRSISKEASASLEEQLNEVVTQIDAWTESTRRVSSASEASALASFGDIRAKADLYAGALRVSYEDLLGKVQAAEERAKEILLGKSAQSQTELGGVSDATLERMTKALDKAVDADGQLLIPMKAMEQIGFPESALKYAASWTLNSSNGKALAKLGYRASYSPAGIRCLPMAAATK